MHTIKMIDSDRHKHRVIYAYRTYVDRICEKKCSPTNKQAINHTATAIMNIWIGNCCFDGIRDVDSPTVTTMMPAAKTTN